jgi:hypothetical protein
MNNQIIAEEWRSVVGFEGVYSVSNVGQIRRESGSNCCPKDRILKQGPSGRGYLCVRLWKNGKSNPRLSHRIVAAAFLGPCDSQQQVNHKNGIKSDNRIDNLEYVTMQQNMTHAVNVLGAVRRGESHPIAKMTDAMVTELRNEYAAVNKSVKKLAAKYLVSKKCVQLIVQRKTWRHVAESAAKAAMEGGKA